MQSPFWWTAKDLLPNVANETSYNNKFLRKSQAFCYNKRFFNKRKDTRSISHYFPHT